MKRKLKNESKHYIETGVLWSYETAEIIDSGKVSLFEDTEISEEIGAVFLERKMIVDGKRFAIHSIFATESCGSPTEKLLSLIDSAGWIPKKFQ